MLQFNDVRECVRLLWFSIVLSIHHPVLDVRRNSKTRSTQRLLATQEKSVAVRTVEASQRPGLFPRHVALTLAPGPAIVEWGRSASKCGSNDESRNDKSQRPPF
jgi:hypothetical protein